jgi:hypothetical protein
MQIIVDVHNVNFMVTSEWTKPYIEIIKELRLLSIDLNLIRFYLGFFTLSIESKWLCEWVMRNQGVIGVFLKVEKL